MAFRSYLLANLDAAMERDEITQVVEQLYKLPEVSFAEPVVGVFDLVVATESAASVDEVLAKIKTIKGLCEVVALKVNPIPSRSRMRKNIEKIPRAKRS